MTFSVHPAIASIAPLEDGTEVPSEELTPLSDYGIIVETPK